MPNTASAFRSLVTNIRLLVAVILVGWVIKLVPSEDHNTLRSIKTLLDAMGKDEDRRKFISRNSTLPSGG